MSGIISIAASLNSHSRSADYSEAARRTAELVTAIADAPELAASLKGQGLPRCYVSASPLSRLSLNSLIYPLYTSKMLK
jgi:beta-phosphoglucomutase-like phosphatase (HAD superfamily)